MGRGLQPATHLYSLYIPNMLWETVVRDLHMKCVTRSSLYFTGIADNMHIRQI